MKRAYLKGLLNGASKERKKFLFEQKRIKPKSMRTCITGEPDNHKVYKTVLS